MKTADLDHLIANLGKAIFTNEELFEGLARQESKNISVDDLTYLRDKLHHPPPVHPDINEKELRLGEWLATCQFVIFELIYLLDLKALNLLESIAFGEYDWTQANALEVICRLYLDGKLPMEKISEIDSRLGSMRYETHLYFAQDLIKRRERDSRVDQIITHIKNIDFRLALAELGHSQPMTREELIQLGKRIISVDSSEVEIQKLMELFDKSVPHPKGSNLFYYPEDFNSRIDDISQYNPSVEEVVDKCLNYKPIML
jgi:colicin immunity protein/pyocin immunity protein